MYRLMTCVALGLLLVCGLQVQAQERQAQQADAAKLVGTWNVVSQEENGTQLAATDVQGKKLMITRDMFTCTDRQAKTELKANYQLTTTRTPWHIQLKPTEGEHKGKTLHGIVQLQADTLKICFADPGQEAPSDFTKTKEGQTCFVLRRAAAGQGQGR